MVQIDVGDGSSAAPDLIPISVSPGQTITITNLAGGNTLNVYTNGIDQAPSTVAANANTTVTSQAWISCPSAVTSVQLTGGLYG